MRTKLATKLKALSFIALICLTLAEGVGLSIIAWHQAEIFKLRTATTEGKIIDSIPGSHSSGTVEYWVDRVRYEIKPAGINDSDVGKSVPVHYDPQHPSDANPGNPFLLLMDS